jgi:hypothetical protein
MGLRGQAAFLEQAEATAVAGAEEEEEVVVVVVERPASVPAAEA